MVNHKKQDSINPVSDKNTVISDMKTLTDKYLSGNILEPDKSEKSPIINKLYSLSHKVGHWLKCLEYQAKEIQIDDIKKNASIIKYIKKPTEEMCLEAVKINGLLLEFIDNQTEEICLEAINQNKGSVKYVKNQTEKIALEVVRKNGSLLKYIQNQNPRICLEAVENNPSAIMYVENQTKDICLVAVKKYGLTIKYVKNQIEDVCLEAVKNNAGAIKYIKEQTEAICLEAISQNIRNIFKCKKITAKMCFYALCGSEKLHDNANMKKGLEVFIKRNSIIKNKIFVMDNNSHKILRKNPNLTNYEIIYLNELSFKLVDTYLMNNQENYFFITKDINEDILKKISVSNNSLWLVLKDKDSIKPIHRMISNEIVSIEELNNLELK